MDSSHYNPTTYEPWNSPYSPHLHPPSAPLLPPPPPLPPPRQSHPDSPNFYARSTQSNGQRHDYHHQYSHHRQDLPPNPPVNQPSSYYSQHPPPPQQHNQPPPLQQLQQQHPQYIPQQVSYEPQRISQPLSSSIQCTESREIAQSDWPVFNEKRHDPWTVDAAQGRTRVDDGLGRNYQYDYSRSSRDSSGVTTNRALDGSSRSRDELRSLGYVRKESGATRIDGNYQDRGQLKSEFDRYYRGLNENNRVSSPTVVYGSERHGVSVTVSRNMTRSSASHEGARTHRWDEARNGGRTLYPRKKDDYHHSEVEKYIDRGRREESNELNRTPRKQMQKKSALLRLETPRSYQNNRENDWSRQHNHHNGKRFNSNSYRGKEQLGHSDRGLVEKQRGRTPVDLDVSFKSNVLVAKPVASPTNAGIRSGASVTPRSSKARRALLSENNEKASLTEGNEKLRTHLSFEVSVSEERKSIGSSDGSLGYEGKDLQKSSLDASIYFNREDPGSQVFAKSDFGGIKDDNKKISIDSLSHENDSSRGLHMGLVSSATVDVANVSMDLANSNNSASGDLGNAKNSASGDLTNASSFTVGSYINTMVKSPDMSVVMESKNLLQCEKTVNPSVENVSRKEYMETTPLNMTTEMVDNMDSDEGKQTCVNGTSSMTKFAVMGSLNVLPMEKTDGCSHNDKSDLAMAVPSEVCMENVSAERNVNDEDLVLKSHPPEIPHVDQFSGTDSRYFKACLSESNFSLSKDLTDCASDSLVEGDASQSDATFCDKLPRLSAFVTETYPAVEINGMSGTERDMDTESSLQEIEPCKTVCKLFPEDHSGCGLSGAIGSVRNLSMDKNLEKGPSMVSSCLVSDSSVSPCHISPLVVENEHIQNKTSFQANCSDFQGAIMHKENDCAEMIEVDIQEEKAKPSGGTSKCRTLGTNIIAGSGDSVLSCDSLSSSPRRNFRQIRSEVHVAAVVDASSKGKEKPKPSGNTSKSRNSGTDIAAVRRDSVLPCDSLSSSPRLHRPIRSEIHVASMVDDTSKSKEETDPSGETSKHRTSGTVIIAGSGDSTFPSNSLSSSPRLNCRQLRSEIHVAAMVDESNKGKESQHGDDILDSLPEQIMTSHEVTQPALSCDGKVSGTEIPGDTGVRVSRSYSHADVKVPLTHVKDDVVSVPNRDFQSKTSMISKYEIEKKKMKSNYSAQKSYPSSLPFVSDTKKGANPPVHITKRHTWHRKSDTSSSSFGAAKPLSSTLSKTQIVPRVTAKSSSSYVRKGNSLLRKPSPGAPGVALGMAPSAVQLNHFTVQDKSMGSSSMVDADNASSIVKTGKILTLERQSNPLSDSSTSKVSNAIATSSGKCALSYSMDHLTTGLPESIMDSATSGEAYVPHSGGDTFKTSDTLVQTDNTSDCQQKRNLPNSDSSNLKRMVYVKRKANQLVAASDILGVSTNQIPPSDGYFKRSKNQLVRNSESCVNLSISLPDDALDTRSATNMVSERSSSSAFSDSAVMRPFKQSKFSLVWTQNDPQPKMPIAHMRYQKILPQLVPWKRVTYWRRLMNSASAYRNGSFSNISQKLSMMRKRHTVYTRSTNGYSLRKSKVLSIGGSHLKWSKSIERDSRKANEEATLAVAAFSKIESEKHSEKNNPRTTSRNHLARERVFRFGSLRYKMDSSRRTLQRISDVDPPCSGSSENGKGVKRPFIPKRLVIGNEEYVRVGNGNQLVRDPKKRIRVLANEKVRWSLHNVRLRLAKKKKYCQFFTRFGKCNKDDGKCPYVHDPSKIAVCTKFLNGLCANANCKLTHKVIPERMPDCSYFLQGLCNNEACPYRHVHVNPSAAICDGFLKGYCSDGDECRKKHSYICPVYEASGSCSKGLKCKLHHPKLQSKGRKRKRPSEPSQKNSRGRYFGSQHNVLSESEPMILDRCSTDSEVFGMEGLDFIILGTTEYEAGDNSDPATEQFISRDNDSPISIYNLIRPVALMQ
ncbi:uncharacterized protein At1g21580 isoform X2 [Capsella rubella]|uniref:uncharacterized protein At1g21580 isoform X2 n=1 Tax=Capsella rubella TaxID=81985 RepID=UPI000CD4C2CE|nr:uncharacterized protein At1g21580 isoform X2 [Capsella rubella]